MEHLIIRFLASACEDPRVEKVTNCEDDGLLLAGKTLIQIQRRVLDINLLLARLFMSFYHIFLYFPSYHIVILKIRYQGPSLYVRIVL